MDLHLFRIHVLQIRGKNLLAGGLTSTSSCLIFLSDEPERPCQDPAIIEYNVDALNVSHRFQKTKLEI